MFPLTCRMCRGALEEPGGLLFGVPDITDQVKKTHLCKSCTALVDEFIEDNPRLAQRKK